jgi:hypothetical protein
MWRMLPLFAGDPHSAIAFFRTACLIRAQFPLFGHDVIANTSGAGWHEN